MKRGEHEKRRSTARRCASCSAVTTREPSGSIEFTCSSGSSLDRVSVRCGRRSSFERAGVQDWNPGDRASLETRAQALAPNPRNGRGTEGLDGIAVPARHARYGEPAISDSGPGVRAGGERQIRGGLGVHTRIGCYRMKPGSLKKLGSMSRPSSLGIDDVGRLWISVMLSA